MFDAVNFCEDYNIPYWTEGKNMTKDWVSVTCPFCSDTSNHGGFNIVKGYYNCWKCGPKALYPAVQKFTGISNIKPILKKYGVVRDYEDIPILNEKKSLFCRGKLLLILCTESIWKIEILIQIT